MVLFLTFLYLDVVFFKFITISKATFDGALHIYTITSLYHVFVFKHKKVFSISKPYKDNFCLHRTCGVRQV